MNDVQKLAQKCADLWAGTDKGDDNPFSRWNMVRHSLNKVAVTEEAGDARPATVGWLRNAVEIEVAARGWSCGWHMPGFQSPPLGHTFFALEWFGGCDVEERVDIEAKSSVAAALTALEWFLVNPADSKDARP